MSGLETAIRNALERSERTNSQKRAPAFISRRASALEAGLRKQDIDDPEAINYQRHRLEGAYPRYRTGRACPPRGEAGAADGAGSAGDCIPDRGADAGCNRIGGILAGRAPLRSRGAGFCVCRTGDSRVPEPALGLAREPSFEDDLQVSPRFDRDMHADDEGPMPDMRSERPLKAPRRRRGVVAQLLIMSIFLATLGIGAWWVYSSGLLLSEAERDTSVPNPPPRVESEDFSGTPEATAPAAPTGPQAIDARGGFSDDWIEVFEPQQVSALRPRANALVDIVTASDGSAAQIVSRSKDAAGAVEVTVPTEILREMAGAPRPSLSRFNRPMTSLCRSRSNAISRAWGTARAIASRSIHRSLMRSSVSPSTTAWHPRHRAAC